MMILVVIVSNSVGDLKMEEENEGTGGCFK
jgi:hypothetical protein